MRLLPTIRRTRLIEEISDGAVRAVKLIAPAGYGKTTLVSSALEMERAYALVDLDGVTSSIDVFRRLIVAIAPFQVDRTRRDAPDMIVALGDDERAWEGLVGDFLSEVPQSFVLVLDNAEALHDEENRQTAIERTITRLPAGARIVVCSRQNVVRFGRFSGPDRTRVLSARDLRFSTSEIRDLFGSLQLARGELEAIERFTQGWPIVVMMLFALARRGRLGAYLREHDDEADLYAYLATEVFATLPANLARFLEALAAVPDASRDDLALLFPDDDVPHAIRRLASETPFVSRVESRITLHPAMREMIAGSIDVDTYRGRLFELVSRRDGGARAAELALLRNQPLDAARVLVRHGSPARPWSPGYAEIISKLPESVYVEYPALWGAAYAYRTPHDMDAAIATGERLLATIAPDMPGQNRIDLMSAVITLLVDRGELSRAQEITDSFASHPGLRGDGRTLILRSYFSAVISGTRGDPIDVPGYLADFASLYPAAPPQQAFRDAIVLASHYRVLGEAARDRATVERGVEVARGTNSSYVICTSMAYAAMSAWFWGEDVLFERYIDELDKAVTPSLNREFRLFIDCARGRGNSGGPGAERRVMRAYGYAIGATRAREPSVRRLLGESALVAAVESSNRFCQVIAHVVLAGLDPDGRSLHLDRADELASSMRATALAAALKAMRAGRADGTMLEALVRDIAPMDEVRESNGLAVDFRDGNVRVGSDLISLSRRERELLAFLARSDGAVGARTAAAAIWPERSPAQALVSLRVTVSRIRKRVGSVGVIVATKDGYAVDVRHGNEENTSNGTAC